jgi:hypothetical protein
MKRVYSLLCIFLFFASVIVAKTRTQQVAMSVAKSFVESQIHRNGVAHAIAARTLPVSLSCVCSETGFSKEASACNADVYIYNIGENDGFVIVSGDDCAQPVLGYADSGHFDLDKIPDNAKNWINSYVSAIEGARNMASVVTSSTGGIELNLDSTEISIPKKVEPLLRGIMWGQGSPYNSLCPKTSAGVNMMAGCVATAMAQIMKKWEWPYEGYGQNTYTYDGTRSLTTYYSGTKYEWSKMTETYGDSSTSDQKKAVAQLMIHCGTASKMQFGESASSTTIYQGMKGMTTYFGYDADAADIRYKDSFGKEDWIHRMKQEIADGRPVMYSANDKNNTFGHAFVCDGYDEKNYFHINWGWDGVYNGYFTLYPLILTQTGLDMSYGSFVVVNLAPEGKIEPKREYCLMGGNIISHNSQFLSGSYTDTYVDTLTNNSLSGVTLNIGVGMYDFNGNLINYNTPRYVSYQSMTSTTALSVTMAMPDRLSDGLYYMRPVYTFDGDNKCYLVKERNGQPNSLRLIVKNSLASVSSQRNCGANLSLTSLLMVDNAMMEGSKPKFVAKIKNNGCEYYSDVSILLVDKSISANNRVIGRKMVDIPSNATSTITFEDTISVPASNYCAYLMYDKKNYPVYIKKFSSLGDSLDFKVSKISVPDTVMMNGLVYQKNDTTHNASLSAYTSSFKSAFLQIPDSVGIYRVTAIDTKALAGCDSITDLFIGKNVKTISDSAFIHCNGLRKVVFYSDSVHLGKDCFDKTLTDVFVPVGSNPYYLSIFPDSILTSYPSVSTTQTKMNISMPSEVNFRKIDAMIASGENDRFSESLEDPQDTVIIAGLKPNCKYRISYHLVDVLGDSLILADSISTKDIHVVVVGEALGATSVLCHGSYEAGDAVVVHKDFSSGIVQKDSLSCILLQLKPSSNNEIRFRVSVSGGYYKEDTVIVRTDNLVASDLKASSLTDTSVVLRVCLNVDSSVVAGFNYVGPNGVIISTDTSVVKDTLIKSISGLLPSSEYSYRPFIMLSDSSYYFASWSKFTTTVSAGICNYRGEDNVYRILSLDGILIREGIADDGLLDFRGLKPGLYIVKTESRVFKKQIRRL